MSAMDVMLDRLTIINGEVDKRWSQEDDDFLKENLGFLSEEDIAKKLKRTVQAVHLRWKRDLHLTAPSKDPRYITGNRIAEALGVDVHVTVYWIDRGLLPGEILPSPRLIRRVLKSELIKWILDTNNWVYFKPERVPDPNLRRLIEQKKVEWGDEWWTTPQVAEHLGISTKDVLRYIQLGRIKARRVPGRGGRHSNPYWANWFILKSEATRPDIVIHRRIKHD